MSFQTTMCNNDTNTHSKWSTKISQIYHCVDLFLITTKRWNKNHPILNNSGRACHINPFQTDYITHISLQNQKKTTLFHTSFLPTTDKPASRSPSINRWLQPTLDPPSPNPHKSPLPIPRAHHLHPEETSRNTNDRDKKIKLTSDFPTLTCTAGILMVRWLADLFLARCSAVLCCARWRACERSVRATVARARSLVCVFGWWGRSGTPARPPQHPTLYALHYFVVLLVVVARARAQQRICVSLSCALQRPQSRRRTSGEMREEEPRFVRCIEPCTIMWYARAPHAGLGWRRGERERPWCLGREMGRTTRGRGV